MGKRASTSQAGGIRKKPAAAIQAEKCSEIATGLKDAKELGEGYPASYVDMLSSMASASIGVYKELRHPHQTQVIGQIETTLKAIDSGKKAKVAEIKKGIDGKDKDKTARAENKAAAEKNLSDKKAVLANKKEALGKANEDKAEKSAALTKAKKEEKVECALHDKIAAEKDRLEKGLASLDACPLDKKSVSSLTTMAKDYKVDKSLVESMHTALTKGAEARGTFDNVIMTTLKEAFTGKVAEKNKELSDHQPKKDACADAVAKATDALAAADAHEKGCDGEVTEAEKGVSDGASAVKQAAKAVANWLPDLKVKMDSYDDAVDDLKTFQEGPLAAFQELVNLETPPPEPEPEIEAEKKDVEEGEKEKEGEVANSAVPT